MISYFVISERIISFWSTRQIARGEEVGKTSVLSSIFFGFGTIPIYILLTVIVATQSNADLNILLLGMILLPVFIVSQNLAAINLGHKPYAISFGLLTFELVKIPAAVFLIIILDLSVEGVIISVLIAYLARIVILAYFAKPKLVGKFSLGTIKRWFKLSWVPIFIHFTMALRQFDVFLYSIITGSVIGLAFFNASFIIAGIINHSALISQALYPKLLAVQKYKLVQENFTLLMYFAIPLLGTAIIFAKPALFALNPLYVGAELIVILLSFRTFFLVIRDVLETVLLGSETIDIEQNPSFTSLRKSMLFFVPNVRTIHFVIYISVLIISFFILYQLEFSELEIVTWWAGIALLIELGVFIYVLFKFKKTVKISIPIVPIGKYVFSTILAGVVFLITSEFLIEYHQSIYEFLPGLVIQFLICAAIYLGTTYLIDKKTRKFFQTILKEL